MNVQHQSPDMYATAWHADETYNDRELRRFEVACRQIAQDAAAKAQAGRYRVADVGCGVGPLRQWLDERQFDITGLEISEQAARIARGNYDRCHVCDVEQPWPLEPQSMDAVLA